MAENSRIEWTDHTANLWWGCVKVHAGCDHCYAEALSHRYGKKLWGPGTSRQFVKSVWKDLTRYQKLAAEAGRIDRVFVGSMMDIFEKAMPVVDAKGEPVFDAPHGMVERLYTGMIREELFENIRDGFYPNLVFLLLTKRHTNIRKMVPQEWLMNPPRNVMFGASAVDQRTYDAVAVMLDSLKIEYGYKTFISMEPQLEHIALNPYLKLDWLIQGGESGGKKRPFDVGWAESMMLQCARLGIPYFFKQIDKVQDIPEHLRVQQFPLIH